MSLHRHGCSPRPDASSRSRAQVSSMTPSLLPDSISSQLAITPSSRLSRAVPSHALFYDVASSSSALRSSPLPFLRLSGLSSIQFLHMLSLMLVIDNALHTTLRTIRRVPVRIRRRPPPQRRILPRSTPRSASPSPSTCTQTAPADSSAPSSTADAAGPSNPGVSYLILAMLRLCFDLAYAVPRSITELISGLFVALDQYGLDPSHVPPKLVPHCQMSPDSSSPLPSPLHLIRHVLTGRCFASSSRSSACTQIRDYFAGNLMAYSGHIFDHLLTSDLSFGQLLNCSGNV